MKKKEYKNGKYTQFEQIIQQGKEREENENMKGTESKMYKILMESKRGKLNQNILKEIWEDELGYKICENEWNRIWEQLIDTN